MAANQYGDISPTTAQWTKVQLLKRGIPYLHYEKFGQVYALSRNSTNLANFRRYYLTGATGSAGSGSAGTLAAPTGYSVPLALTPLTEGVTPAGKTLSIADYVTQLQQYGDYVPLSDVIQDLHPDPVLAQATEVLGEQAAQTIETTRFNVLKSGTNIGYAGGTSLATVSGPVTLGRLRQIATQLNRQNARKITEVVASTPDFNTKSVEASYFAITHPDLESDYRAIPAFKPVADYGPHTTPFEGEIGSVEQFRILTTTINTPETDAGAAAGTTYRSTSGTNGDVYTTLFFGKDAYGIVPLKGGSAITPMVVNPKPAPGDPLGQRGTVGWKAYTATRVLNDAWLVVYKSLASIAPG